MPRANQYTQHSKKESMIKALESSLGVVTSAAKAVGMDQATHYKWLKLDPAYKERVEAIADIALDFAESKLHDNIGKGDTTATIFYLKTKGKKRGYIEKQEIDHSGEVGVTMKIINYSSNTNEENEQRNS